MKRTFQLHIEGKKPERVLDSIKHEVRKYLKRERRRVVPEGFDFWDFDCKFGTAEENAETVHLSSVIPHIDEISKSAGAQLYVEIIATPRKRKPRQSTQGSESDQISLATDQTEVGTQAPPSAAPNL